jgi:biotin synthase
MTPPDIRGNYLLYKRDRFIMTEERILADVNAEGLKISEQSLAEYWRTKRENAKLAMAKTEPVQQ